MEPPETVTDQIKSLWERALVLRCQAGDASAFNEIVEVFHPRIRLFAISLLGQEDNELDDLLQDVWLSVYTGIGRLRCAGSFRAWLYQIVRNKCAKTFCAKRWHLVTLNTTDDLAERLDETGMTRRHIEVLPKTMGRLSVEHREVLLLRYWEGFSSEETAQVIGVKVGTVRSRCHYAKEKLKEKLLKEVNHDDQE